MILFSDRYLIAVNKPPGFTVHDAPGNSVSVMRLLREQQGLTDLTPIHRLDKDASGVLLLAKNKSTASDMQRKWGDVEKTYVALCENAPFNDAGTIDAPILEHQTGKPARLDSAVKYFKKQNPRVPMPPLPAPKTSGVHPAGRASQTRYRVLERFKTASGIYSLLEVTPLQGRMHHIRVHLKHLGCPLALDPLYGRAESSFQTLTRLPLHAARLVFPYQNKKMTIDAPLPEDIASTLNAIRLSGNDPVIQPS